MAKTETTQDARVFNIKKVEEDIAALFPPGQRPVEYAPPLLRAQAGVAVSVPITDDLGRLTSQAVSSQYDEAIKSLELMGQTLLACVRDAEAMSTQCRDALDYVRETADFYRAEAKRISDHIAHASRLTGEVRNVCDDMRERIRQPLPTAEALKKVDDAAEKEGLIADDDGTGRSVQ